MFDIFEKAMDKLCSESYGKTTECKDAKGVTEEYVRFENRLNNRECVLSYL